MDPISTLDSVVSTLDTISVAGLENMNRLVSCASAIMSVARQLREDQAKQQEPTVTGVNGTPPDAEAENADIPVIENA